MICKICGQDVKNKGITSHLRKHKMSDKEYYDKYIKSGLDGICKVCGKPTKFFGNVLGYGKHNKKDLETIQIWTDKAKTRPQYKVALDVWTNKDVQKYKCAKKNKLNYIVLWNKNEVQQFIQNFTNYTTT